MSLEEMILEYEKIHGTDYKIQKKKKQTKPDLIFTEYLPGEIKEV